MVARELRLIVLCSGPEFSYAYPTGDRIDSVAAIYQALEVEGDVDDGHEREGLELRYFGVERLASPMHSLSERQLERALEVLAL